ncbi:MAG TPA: cysteine desulfurase [Gammaproteobacteria bacterium]|nr:cysteine desulfurase [Gammaproteobacteria bacterium]
MAIYLDYNASTPLDAQVLETMTECLSGLPGNPSSTHQFGRAARDRIEAARQQVAALVGVQPAQVIFTGGGTEANNLALHAVTAGRLPARLAVSAVEHPSVLEAARALTGAGWQLDLIGVDARCRVTAQALQQRLHPDTRLVSVMMANNETGVIQDIAALAGQVRAAGAILHSDAVQAVGKIAVDFAASGVHLMSLSAHKIYGPKGVGALIVDKSLQLVPLVSGGGQEKGMRAGTENVAAIAGFGVAAELAQSRLEQQGACLQALRERLEQGLARYPQVTVFAAAAERLPNTVQLAVAGIDGETLLMQLDRAGFAVSSGSACASGKSEASHVLLAMGVDEQLAHGAIRISLGADTSAADIDALLNALEQQIKWVQKASQAAGW